MILDSLPLPTVLESSLGAVQEAAIQYLLGGLGMDHEDPATDTPSRFRLHTYFIEVPGTAAVRIRYRYRVTDQVIWSITVANAYGHYRGKIGMIPLNANINQINAELGEPIECRQRAPVVDTCWWDLAESSYRVDFYNQRYDDIARTSQVGEVETVEVYSRSLGPSGYDAGRTRIQ